MKHRITVLLASIALATPSALLAQAAAPASSTTTPAAGTGTAPATKPGSDKPKPLGSTEKKFVKDSTDTMYLVLESVGKVKDSAGAEATKKLGEKLKTDLDKIWADVAGFATANGETLPSELKGADKSAIERLNKADKEKWDKQFLNLAGREMKKLARNFDAGKNLQNAELKGIAEKWKPTVSGYDAEITAVEKENAKK